MNVRARSRVPKELWVPALVLTLVLAGTWLAPRWRELAVPLQVVLGALGCGLIAVHAWSVGETPAHLGVRGANLLPATFAFGVATAALSLPVVLASGGDSRSPFPLGELPSYFAWALFQQYLAVGGFWLPFRRAWGLEPRSRASTGRELLLAGAAALVFAAAHAPNVGLMALVGLAEWIWLFLFARWRNLFSLSLAHAASALVVAHHLVPSPWIRSMRVGLDYFRS